MKLPPRSTRSNASFGFLIGLIGAPIVVFLATAALVNKNSEVGGLIFFAVIGSPAIGLVFGGIGALVGHLMKGARRSAVAFAVATVALAAPVICFSVLVAANNLQSLGYKRASLSRAAQIDAQIRADFPKISGLTPKLEAVWSDSYGPGVWYDSKNSYADTLFEIYKATGEAWDHVEMTRFAIFCKSDGIDRVNIILVSEDGPGSQATVTLRRSHARGALYTIAGVLQKQLARRDREAFLLLTPRFQRELVDAAGLMQNLPSDKNIRVNGTNFGAESIRGPRAELEIQIGEIATKEGNGERRDWVMAQAEFAQTNGLWKLDDLTIKSPKLHSRSTGTPPPTTPLPAPQSPQ